MKSVTDSNENEALGTENYLPLLQLAFQVVDILDGEKAEDPSMSQCNRLAVKLVSHASSVYMLSKGTKVETQKPFAVDFIDFSSILILVRVTFELYLKLYEIFFMPEDTDERLFRYGLWELSGFKLREQIRFFSPRQENKLKKAKIELEDLRNRIRQTKFFQKFSEKEQDYILRMGKVPGESWKEVARKANFYGSLIDQAHRFWSSHVHSDGLSGAQLIGVNSREDQEQYLEGNLAIVMMVMGRLVVHYSQAFPQSRRVCETEKHAHEIALHWARLASELKNLDLLPRGSI